VTEDSPATASQSLLRELLLASSRTFALGIERLREPLRSEVRIAYLLLRISDYLEDSTSFEAAERADLLDIWDGALAQQRPVEELASRIHPENEEELPDARVAAEVTMVHQAISGLGREAGEIVVRYVRESTRGMARWARRGSDFANLDDLDDYMHEVAGRVGYLLTELFALRDPHIARAAPELMPLGRSFGLGLQTVNVIRGLHSDHHRGWLFVPRSFMETRTGPIEGSPSALFAPNEVELRKAVLTKLSHEALRHLDDALIYLTSIPRRHTDIRLFCALPILYAERTLALTLAEGDDVFFREIKMTRKDVRNIGRAAVLSVRSNTLLRLLSHRLRR